MFPYSIFYHIEKDPFETPERYAYRCWFVAKQKPKTTTELKQAIKWSFIDTHIMYDNCKYTEDIMDMAQRLTIRKFE